MSSLRVTSLKDSGILGHSVQDVYTVPRWYPHDFFVDAAWPTIEGMAFLSWQVVHVGFCALALMLLWAVEQK